MKRLQLVKIVREHVRKTLEEGFFRQDYNIFPPNQAYQLARQFRALTGDNKIQHQYIESDRGYLGIRWEGYMSPFMLDLLKEDNLYYTYELINAFNGDIVDQGIFKDRNETTLHSTVVRGLIKSVSEHKDVFIR